MAYFKVKASYSAMQENGQIGKTTREVVVDAILYGEVERRVAEEITPFTSDGEIFQVINRYPIAHTVMQGGDNYFRIQIVYKVVDDKGKEKENKEFALVESDDIGSAQLALHEYMEGTLADWDMGKVETTNIRDVFFYASENK